VSDLGADYIRFLTDEGGVNTFRFGKPLLKTLGLPASGLHAFRHGAVTMHRKAGTPEHLLRQWIGHSTLGRITDRYSHTDEEIEYRRQNVLSLDQIIKVG
jgi:integrase